MASSRTPIRQLAYLFGIVHNVSYYADEMSIFQKRGIARYWHGYLAYRSAPLGTASPSAVCSTFYNFAPTLVAEAIPAVWEVMTPDEAMDLRDGAILRGLDRAFGDERPDADAAAIADLTLTHVLDQPVVGRTLFAAHRDLPIPDDPVQRLWHAATLWREYRGDAHNIALAAHSIDGIECHVLMAAKGVADQRVIEKIRGWDKASWDAAHARLMDRGLVETDGTATSAGLDYRADIERQTDELSNAPVLDLGEAVAEELITRLQPIVEVILGSGIVPARWPPPKLDG